jgi:IstB-like ATP binding protein
VRNDLLARTFGPHGLPCQPERVRCSPVPGRRRTCSPSPAWSARPASAEPPANRPWASPVIGAGYKVRYLTAADITETLFRGLGDDSVEKIIDTLFRNDLIMDEVGLSPLDDTRRHLLFRVMAACERRALSISSHWLFDQMGTGFHGSLRDGIVTCEEKWIDQSLTVGTCPQTRHEAPVLG